MAITSFDAWCRKKEIAEFSQWLKSEGYDPIQFNLDNLIEEGVWDNVKKWGKNAAVAGTLAGAGLGMFAGQNSRPINDPHAIRNAFDKHSTNPMSPEKWKELASKFPGDIAGFVPDPKQPGSWIPANGADAVRIQSFTNVNNDELKQDTIGHSLYKNGKPISGTKWSDGEPNSRSSYTKFDGPGLYRQATNK